MMNGFVDSTLSTLLMFLLSQLFLFPLCQNTKIFLPLPVIGRSHKLMPSSINKRNISLCDINIFSNRDVEQSHTPLLQKGGAVLFFYVHASLRSVLPSFRKFLLSLHTLYKCTRTNAEFCRYVGTLERTE